MAFEGRWLRDRSRCHGQSQKSILSSFFDPVYFPNPKRLTIKAFLEVSLVSLILTARTVLKLKKNAGNFAVLVCCTAAN